MDNVIVLDLLNKYLGEGVKRKDLNYAFHCPFCKNSNPDKVKLEVDTNIHTENRGNWNCWVCHTRGKSIYSLLKRLNASPQDLSLLGYRRVHETYTYMTGSISQVDQPIELPAHYTSFTFHERDTDVQYIFKKLKSRQVTEDDIIKYKIGYLNGGKFKYNVVLPSYNSEGKLNYYSLKNFRTEEYKNPPTSRNVVIFDMFINWNEDIVVVEGMFDAFAVQRNVTPLLGKTLTKALKERIVSSNCKKVYIALDGEEDAAIDDIAQYIHSIGKKPYKVDLPPEEDPSSIGKEGIWQYIHSAKLVDNSNTFLQNLKARW